MPACCLPGTGARLLSQPACTLQLPPPSPIRPPTFPPLPCRPAPPPLLQARIQGETNDAKNALEAYIYGLRNRLADSLAPYVREEAKAALLEKLEALEVSGWVGRVWG